ncbi:MAG TPA: uracil-DNA glycosylase [Candidatus Woesebacteria bacterium]|nr:uracil-DNA glycosylase [Candidatus Woesebacteria bacterium]
MNFTDLKELQADLERNYQKLPLVHKVSDIVHGEGNEHASVMLIGEAPGYYESVQRRPFVGRSGQLLRQILVASGLSENQVYISNIIKVRPPDNRDPLPSEILAFKPYLDDEINLIKPKLIVTLGRFSMAKFLPDVKVSQVHGRLHKIKWNERTLFILPMYHPAAALRATQVKESFIQDFNKITKIIAWIDETSGSEEFKETVKKALL